MADADEANALAVSALTISAPEPLSDGHLTEEFECTQPSLSVWLRDKALHNEQQGASRCIVVTDLAVDRLQKVVGYYCLAAGSVSRLTVTGKIRRNMPEPIPIVVLGRLAVHRDYEGQGIGSGLLQDATRRCVRAAQKVGVRALLCHAINASAKNFYLHHGFVQSPVEPMTVMLELAGIAQRLGA